MRISCNTLILGTLLIWQIGGPALADHDRRGYGNARNGTQIQRQAVPRPVFERRVQNRQRRGNSAAGSSHQRARDAVRSGQIRPLHDVLTMVKRRFPGRVLDADLQDRGGNPVYRVKMLTADGDVLSVLVDARSNRILGVRGRAR